MTEKNPMKIEKSPLGAAFLSTLFPGVGALYVGNMVKGIAYMFVFITILLMLIKGGGHQAVVFALALAGFYIFQVIDAYNDAQKSRYIDVPETNNVFEDISLFWAVIILIVGILFLLDNLNIVCMRTTAKFWPLALVILGGKLIYSYVITNREKQNEGENSFNEIDEKNGGKNE